MVTSISSSVFMNSNFSKKVYDRRNEKHNNNIPLNYNFCLNKSFSKNIVDYAHNLCSTVLNLKNSSKELSYFVDEYKIVEDKIENLDEEKKQKVNSMFKEKMKNFIDTYDLAVDFANKQNHSQSLLNFSSELFEITDSYENVLKNLNYDSERMKNFDLTNIHDKKSINEKLDGIKLFANEIYNSTTDVLSKPMSEHMNFRDLHYYYNYKLDKYQSDTFALIEVGMIVDVTL